MLKLKLVLEFMQSSHSIGRKNTRPCSKFNVEIFQLNVYSLQHFFQVASAVQLL